QSTPISSFDVRFAGAIAMDMLSDCRVLILAAGLDNRIYDPTTASLAPVPFMVSIPFSTSARLLPDGRVLVRGFDITGPIIYIADQLLYDPQTSTIARPSLTAIGPDVLLPDGTIL